MKTAAINKSKSGKSFTLMASTAHVKTGPDSRGTTIKSGQVIAAGFKTIQEARKAGEMMGYEVF